ncbi:MAG TPA: hypothetical protein VL172_11795 [Kofleriaceae bacterium]|jgi:hypothetical protein|nr:hypothetical protein [Kofleriaceae bacterium]
MGRAYMFGMVGVLVLGTGCPGPAPPSMDAGDHDASPDDPDAPPGNGGLSFLFVANPNLPTAPDGNFEVVITEADYWLTDVRAVGDAAPGDSRTSRESYQVQFDGSRLDFPLAPQGIYSYLLAAVDHYQLQGTMVQGANTYGFEIDDQPSALELQIDLKQLELGAEPVVCVIQIDLRKITQEVDWAPLQPDEDDEIEIQSDYPDIAKLRDRADDFTKQ